MLRTAGWFVVHSLWIGSVAAAATAMVLSLLGDTRARARYVIAFAGLLLMAAAPVVAVSSQLLAFRSAGRSAVMGLIEQTIGVPPFFWWASVIIPVAGALWIGGVIVSFVRLAWEWRRVRALRSSGAVATDPALRESMTVVARRIATRDADVRVSDRAAVPMVVGWRMPAIVLPRGMQERLSAAQLRGVLAHELAHIQRRDPVANLVQACVAAMLFHHPGAAWLSRRIRTEREYCCDDAAVGVSGDPHEYTRALASLEDARADSQLAIAAASGTLLDRLQRVVGAPRPILTPIRAAAALAVSVAIAAAIFMVSMSVPPSLPWRAEVRARSPFPAGAATPAPSPAGLERQPRTR